jgi:cell division protein FtsI (penicillin-binding protein 3)
MYSGYGNNLYSLSTLSLRLTKQRILFIVSIFLILFMLIAVRLARVMVFNAKADEEHGFENAIPVISRADITDRNGVIVATSLPTVSLYACPHEIINPEESAGKIADVFRELDRADLTGKLSSGKKFLWIKRNLSPTQQQAVLNQGVPGMHFMRTEHRVYPDGSLLAHVIGGTDIDNIGISGIEKVFDESLRGSTEPLKLSLDVKIQYAVRDELQKGIKKFGALGGAAVVMKISTGEITALVSLPDFDPNKSSDPRTREHFNMVTSSAVEPGSSAKIFNTAMALETGKITPFTTFDARFPLKVGRFTVNDFHGLGTFLSVEEILKYSSNIGSAKIALAVGAAAQKNFFERLGLLDPISCELSETQRPIYPHRWTDITCVTVSYGHGIAISPLHMITAVSGIINDGILNNPTLLKRETPLPGKRVVSKKTSDIMKALMRINVTGGTNRLVEVPGYCIGGKSGTAEKQKHGRYVKNKNYTGFVGVFPMTDPKYAVYLLLDEPKGIPETRGYRTGGWNAAPVCGCIIKRIGAMLGITASKGPEPNWKAVLGRLH